MRFIMNCVQTLTGRQKHELYQNRRKKLRQKLYACV